MISYSLYAPLGTGVCITTLLHRDYSPAFVRKHEWKFYFLYSQIIKASFRRDDKWVRVYSDDLRTVLGRVTFNGKQELFYLHIREKLRQWGIIRQYTEQAACTRKAYYRLNDEVACHGFVTAPDVRLPRKYLRKLAPPITYHGVYGKLQRSFQRITIDHEQARLLARDAFITQLPLPDKRGKGQRIQRDRYVNAAVYARWLAMITCIQEGELYFVINHRTTGRAATSFTSFPKLLRRTIRLNNKLLHEIDVSACQPLLLTKLAQEYCTQQGVKPGEDLRQWQRLCEQGKIYPYLYAHLLAQDVVLPSMFAPRTKQLRAEMPKAFKVELFASVIFAKDRNTPVRRVFDQLFPTISAAIRHYKQPNHRKLAHRLQRMESDLMLRTVCAQLYEQKHRDLLTLHDAIYCPAASVAAVVAAIRAAFGALGLAAQLKLDGNIIQPES